MNYLWAGPSKPQTDKAEKAFSSPTSLAARFGNRTTTPSLSPRRINHASSRRFSKPVDPDVNDILETTMVYPSTKKMKDTDDLSLPLPLSFDIARSSDKIVLSSPARQRCRSLSPRKSGSVPCHGHSTSTPLEKQESKVQKPIEDELTDALMALTNADSVIAKATDSFKKTFEFISKSIETTTEDKPLSPSTVSTKRETSTVSPSSPPRIYGKKTEQGPISSTPLNRPVSSTDAEDYDPIMETRSNFSSSPLTVPPATSIAASFDSIGSTRFPKARQAIDNWKSQSRGLEKATTPRGITDASNMTAETATDTNSVTADSAAANRELALLKLQASLSSLGNALSTAAWGEDSQKQSDPPKCGVPSLRQSNLAELTTEESMDRTSPETVARAGRRVVETETSTSFLRGKQSPISCTSNRSHTSDRDPGGLKLQDSLSVLPANGFESAWMSYCDLPTLLHSKSSTLSLGGAPSSAAKSISDNYVSSPVDVKPHDRSSAGTSPRHGLDLERLDDQQNGAGENFLTHEEALAEMHASLGGLLSTLQSSVFGNNPVTPKALETSASIERTKQVCASPQLEGRKQRALEPEEQTDLAGHEKRVGLEPEAQTDFGYEQPLMKVENEDITCLTDDSYEVVSETKYYPVKVANAGIPQCEDVTAVAYSEGSEYVTFSDELVERHIQASFYLEDPLVDVPLDGSSAIIHIPHGERDRYETWADVDYHRSSGSEVEAVNVYTPADQVSNEFAENQAGRSKGDPPGFGPWSANCLGPCITDSADASLTSSNFVFCQSPKDLSDSVSASLLEISSQVQRLDDENHVTENVSKSVAEIGSTLTNIWKKADHVFGVSATTKQVSTVLKETAKNPPKPEDLQKHLQQLDDEHRIIEQTASAVAVGAEYLAQSIESLAMHSSRPGTMITAA